MPHYKSGRATALAALLICLAGPVRSQEAKPAEAPVSAPDAASETLDLAPTFERRLTVPVHLEGEGPFPFVVDTGAERTVVSNDLAQQLDLAPGRPVKMHSMTGQSRVTTAIIKRLEMSRRRVADIHAPVLQRTHIGAAGILGVDTLQSQRIDFDFIQQKMTISASRAAAQPRSDPGTIIVTARSRFGRLVLVDAELEGEKVIVVLDTGSDVTIGNEALRRKLARRGKLKQTMPIGLISVTGGRLVADYTHIEKMRLGGLLISKMPVGFAEVHPFAQLGLSDRPALLLGMDALALFSHVSVDFARRRVTFLLPDARLGERGDARYAAYLGGGGVR